MAQPVDFVMYPALGSRGVKLVTILAAEGGDPLWVSAAQAVGAAVAVVLAIGAYFKFVRSRVFQPRLSLDLAVESHEVYSAPALRVDAEIKNDGQTAVLLDQCFAQLLEVFLADEAVWEDAVSAADGVVLWYDGVSPHRTMDMLLEPGLFGHAVQPYRESPPPGGPSAKDALFAVPDHLLEPGERIRRSLLVPVDHAAAYLVQLSIHACSHANWWSYWPHRRCTSRTRQPDQWQIRKVVPGYRGLDAGEVWQSRGGRCGR